MGPMNHDLFIDPEQISETLVHTAAMGDSLSEFYHKDDLSAYASLLEQCVRFAIPKLLARLMKNKAVAAVEERVVPAVVLEEPVALKERVVPLEEPVEARRSKRSRK